MYIFSILIFVLFQNFSNKSANIYAFPITHLYKFYRYKMYCAALCADMRIIFCLYRMDRHLFPYEDIGRNFCLFRMGRHLFPYEDMGRNFYPYDTVFKPVNILAMS